MATTTLIGALANLLREEIPNGIEDSLPGLDKTALQIKRSNMGVERSGIGRSWQVKHTLSSSILAGGMSWRLASGPSGGVAWDGTSGNGTFTGYNSSTPQNYLGITETLNPGTIQRTLTLVQGHGNVHIPTNLTQVDKLDASIASSFKEITKGVSNRIALGHLHSLFKTIPTGTEGAGSLASFTQSGTTLGTTPTAYTLTGGRIRNLSPGLVVDLFARSGGTKINTVPIAIYSIDPLASAVTLVALASNSDTYTNAASMDIVPYGSRTSGTTTLISPSGFEDWLKSSGTIYGISLTTYPWFKSLVGAETGALSSTILNKYIMGFMQGYDMSIDTFLTTDGVLNGILENIEDAQQLVRYDVTGKPLDVTLGYSGIGYRAGNNLVKFMTSTMMPSQTLYGVKLGNSNIKRYVPPRMDKTVSGFSGDSEVEFMGPAMGYTGPIIPLNNSTGGPTDFVQAPFQFYTEYAPSEIRGIKITGLQESIQTN